MPLDGLYPPAQYGWGWLALAIGIVALIVIAWYLSLTFTRRRRMSEFAHRRGDVPSADVTAALRAEYLGDLDTIEADFRGGRLDGREVNRELSSLVRRYVNEYSGLEAPVLTLADLRKMNVHPALIDAIARHYYPSIFRRNHVVDPEAGISAARKVVQEWH